MALSALLKGAQKSIRGAAPAEGDFKIGEETGF